MTRCYQLLKKFDMLETDSNLRGSSSSLDGIKKVISSFFYNATIELKEKDNNEYEIYNKNGLIKNFKVVKVKNKFRFEKE